MCEIKCRVSILIKLVNGSKEAKKKIHTIIMGNARDCHDMPQAHNLWSFYDRSVFFRLELTGNNKRARVRIFCKHFCSFFRRSLFFVHLDRS